MSGEPPQFLEERHARRLVVDSLDLSNRSPLTVPNVEKLVTIADHGASIEDLVGEKPPSCVNERA